MDHFSYFFKGPYRGSTVLLPHLCCLMFRGCCLNVLWLYSLQGWNMSAQLLIDLFKFLAPFLRNAELTKPTQLLYKVGWLMVAWLLAWSSSE